MTESPHPWRPPTWDTSGSIATYVVRSLPEGIAASIETVCGNDPRLRAWLAGWWESRLDSLRARAANYSDSQGAFVYAVVSPSDVDRDACDPENWQVKEYAEGTYPIAPEDWPELDLVELAEFAISDLTSGIDHVENRTTGKP